MKLKFNPLITLIMITLLIGSTFLPMEAKSTIDRSQQTVYVEPSLRTTGAETISVIVTAEGSSATAATAVGSLGGEVTSDLWLIKAVAATLPANQLETLAATPGLVSIVHNKGVKSAQDPVEEWDGWVTDYRFPVPWDGSPDVQETNSRWAYDVVYPTVIDVGADVYQHGSYPQTESGMPINGMGVTIAVVDSGVYFSEEVKKTLGTWVTNQFKGQADFAGPTSRKAATRTATAPTWPVLSGIILRRMLPGAG